jgi:hypothetical protein
MHHFRLFFRQGRKHLVQFILQSGKALDTGAVFLVRSGVMERHALVHHGPEEVFISLIHGVPPAFCTSLKRQFLQVVNVNLSFFSETSLWPVSRKRKTPLAADFTILREIVCKWRNTPYSLND